MIDTIIAILLTSMLVMVLFLMYYGAKAYIIVTQDAPCDEPLHNHHDGCPKCDYPSQPSDYQRKVLSEDIKSLCYRKGNRVTWYDEAYCTDEELVSIKKYAKEIAHNAMLMDGNHDNWHEEDEIRSYMKKMTVLLDVIHLDTNHRKYSGG